MTTRYTAGLVPDAVARLMRPADRRACGVRTPEERQAKADAGAERDLQRLCELELSRRGIPFLHLSHRARERIGWPDLVFPLPPTGRMVAIELKTRIGRVTTEQADTLADLAMCGALVAVCRSFAEFRDVIGGANDKSEALT